ncbi:hypothetical protein [Streptomyces sp. R41]|uniref:Signal transduction histidine kinase osmosensitive K+ channel sensor N-terminal domain-containing protein n=1 Tax=Streptomyces sp. R41 TaxID=3238632 RepID=A0AB39RMI6_9ACTN
MGRGKLRICLGAAPGVGKTYAMLSEAHRRVAPLPVPYLGVPPAKRPRSSPRP